MVSNSSPTLISASSSSLFGYVHFVMTVLLIKIMTFFRYSFFKVLVYGILSACVLNLFLLPAFCTDRASAADFIAPCIFILAGTAFLVFRMDRERVKDESEELTVIRRRTVRLCRLNGHACRKISGIS